MTLTMVEQRAARDHPDQERPGRVEDSDGDTADDAGQAVVSSFYGGERLVCFGRRRKLRRHEHVYD